MQSREEKQKMRQKWLFCVSSCGSAGLGGFSRLMTAHCPAKAHYLCLFMVQRIKAGRHAES